MAVIDIVKYEQQEGVIVHKYVSYDKTLFGRENGRNKKNKASKLFLRHSNS